MSRQFRFYLLPPQIEELVSALKGEFDFRIIATRSQTREPTELDSVLQAIERNGSGPSSSHVNCYLVPFFESPPLTKYAPRMKDWFIEDARSEVIQLSGCDYDGDKLRIGRFYFQANYVNNAMTELIPHRQVFLKWGEKLFRAAKHQLHYSRDLEAYTDEESELWRQRGGQFVAL